MAGILTLTVNPALDKSCPVERVVPDSKLRCGVLRLDPGGGGINVARVIRRLGGDPLAVYPAGGPTGFLLADLLDRERIRHRPLPIEGWTREDFTATETETGRQYRFVLQGPTLSAREWQACLDAVGQAPPSTGIVVASGSLPPGVPEDFYARLARLCRELGLRLALDASLEPLALAAREEVWLLKPNRRELQALEPCDTASDPDLERAAKSVVERGLCENLVVSLGAGGALAVTRNRFVRLPAPAVAVRSRVGAGDSMMAALVVALARREDLEAATRFGLAAGAAAVTRPGTDLCQREDVERIAASGGAH